VYIHLLLLRLKEQSTDIMITINIPHYKDEYEREKMLETFKVVEWGLFDG
jgi:hypothetical protein